MGWGELYGTLTGYQGAAAIMAADRSGLIAALAGDGGSLDELAARTGASARGVDALVRALVAMGIVESIGSAYRLGPTGAPLAATGPDGLDRLIRKEAVFYALWARLDGAVRTGDALLAPFAERARTEPAAAEAFLLALNDLAGRVAPDLVPAARLEGARSLVDVGGGGGAYALAFSGADPGLDVTIVEQPSVVPLTERALAAAGAAGTRIRVVAGDATRRGLGLDERFDAALVSHLLHDMDPEAARAAVRGAASVLGPGGVLLVHDVFREQGDTDPVVALFDVMMLVENQGGRTHSLADLRGWLVEAGMGEPEVHSLGFTTLLRVEAAG
ncbi:MAG: methyltransferase domain-containing protein [Chloroflexi bacterium]|nr:methyltransferase domain-containing protein [Chloroflexota bacterium]